MHELTQGIARADTPVREQPVARAILVPGEPALGLSQSLQQRNGIGVDEFGIDKRGIAIRVRRNMPLALDMLAQERRPVLILNPARRFIVDPDVVETLRAALETDAHNRALGIEQTASFAPELTALEGIAVAACKDRLRHQVPSLNGGVAFIDDTS